MRFLTPLMKFEEPAMATRIRFVPVVSFILLVCSGSAMSQSLAGKFACNLKALTPDQRTAHGALTHQLLGAVIERREISSGFELRLDSRKISIVGLATWVDAERRCCPFLGLAIEKEPDDGALWLRLTGPEGVKDFLLAEMQVGSR
jgi:hypothetical protein